MHDASQIEAWQHTSSLLALIYNVKRGKGVKAKKPKDFHPYAKSESMREKPKVITDMGEIKHLFVGKKSDLCESESKD